MTKRTIRVSLSTLLFSVALCSQALRGEEPRCTLGDAQSLLRALAVPNVMIDRGLEHPRFIRRLGGFEDSPGQCQYRLFIDGETFTFSERDYFLGATAAFVPYEELGLTRQEVEDELDQVQIRVWLAKLPPEGNGVFVAQPTTRTAWKQIRFPDGTKIMYAQEGFIGHLSAGEYLSYYEEAAPGEPPFSATVHLVITPAP